MYWWNITQLKDALRRGPLSPAMTLRYVIVNALLMTLSVGAPETPSDHPVAMWVARAVITAVSVLGVLYCYAQNGGARGALFMERYFSISWVVYMRGSISLVAALVCLPALSRWLDQDERRLALLALVVVWLMALAWRTGVHIGDVAKGQQMAPSAARMGAVASE